jgi:hypothetical protein
MQDRNKPHRWLALISTLALVLGVLYTLVSSLAYAVRISLLPTSFTQFLGLQPRPCYMILGWLLQLIGVTASAATISTVIVSISLPRQLRNALWQIVLPLALLIAGSMLNYSQVILDSRISEICRSDSLWGVVTTAP